MKRIISIFLIFLLLLCSCKIGKQFNSYDNDNYQDFFTAIYQDINDGGEYFAVDFRDNASYEEGHIRQFHHVEKEEVVDFLKTLEEINPKKTRIYLLGDSQFSIDEIIELKNSFRQIDLLVINYSLVEEEVKSLFIIDKGPYDCGC